MSTLLLRLAAPMQSWGADSKFNWRRTARAPTKSGVVGLIAAALGRRRNESIEDLQALRFGVRADKEGKLLRDYHIAKNPEDPKSPYVTYRYYLSDAVFLVGLEGNLELLRQIEYALNNPVFPLYLGRRSCPPYGRLCLGIRVDKPLEQALKEERLQTSALTKHGHSETSLRIILDADNSHPSFYLLRDMPISFDQSHRRFGFRRVYETTLPAVAGDSNPAASVPTEHDAMSELEG